MKKVVYTGLLIICMSILLSSCKGTRSNTAVMMSFRPVTFEECLDYTSDVVMAKCRQSAEKNGYTEYYFDIETYYFSVHEYRETNIYVIAYPPYDQYKTGDSYFLLLERRPKVLEPRDVYLPVPVEVDINELRNSKVQRKSIEEKSDVTAKELDDFAEFLNYITDHIANGKHNYAKDYIRSNDLAEIAEKTEYLAKVEIVSRKPVGDNNNSGNCYYECKVIENYKEQNPPKETIMISLPDDRVDPGEIYVLAFMHYFDTNSNYLQLSCKKNFFTDEEAGMLKSLCGSADPA